ncbi:hypothetical protein RJ640_004034 [Escallonia rubra]|uniref:GAG-pre-integrase domain-containing protein n=1 Tax=Escallonia rubra TaxID=112253 RepID=A0AA88UEE0_9ASTE|nr:hypothetical protein RJ640_004034 [Escallonia rubra]
MAASMNLNSSLDYFEICTDEMTRYMLKLGPKSDYKVFDLQWIRLGHILMEHLKDISSKELVRGLPKINFEKYKVCDACQMGK